MMIHSKKSKLINYLLIVVNFVLILSIIASFFIYDNSYKRKIFNQNSDEISNINRASASIASTFFSGREAKLRDMALYIEKNNLNLSECMDFIYSTNSDSTKFFEIIDCDGKGYRIEKNNIGKYVPIDYSQGYENMQTMLKKNFVQKDSSVISFASEFTDAYTALKSFALFNSIHLKNDNSDTALYTLMVVSTTIDFIDLININSGYEKLSTAIINQHGDYIIGTKEFKSTDFFKFIGEYNDLSLDATKELKSNFLKAQRGNLIYNDSKGRKSIFVFSPVPNKNWYCVTVVPIVYFHNSDTESFFTYHVLTVMLFLLILDLMYFATLNKKLKVSVENERIAGVAKTDFLARMSHDMRTPMNGIIGMTRLTQDIKNLPEEVKKNLEAISDSSDYLLQLINDTLDMNKIESKKFTLNPETVNSEELIAHIVATVKPLAEQKQINFEFTPINTELAYIIADRKRVQQVFMNILSNAIKFTPKYGRICTVAECIKRENGIAYYRISVEDSGCGMSEEFLKHIFEPFSQEHTKLVRGQEGTGLGMSIVKNLVELMGGSIEIESQLGVGTKVIIYINFKIDYSNHKIIEKKDNTGNIQLCGKNILLVEDHPMNANIAKRILEKKDITVYHAVNGADALKMFSESEIGFYDMILMDIRMPVMDGLTATKQIRLLSRKDAKSIPIIAMTANAYAEDVQSALEAGMNSHLAKPVEPEILYKEIQKYIK